MTATVQRPQTPHPNDIKHLPANEQMIHAHFEAYGGCHWYVAGIYDLNHMFGYVDLGHEQGGEWGDFTLFYLISMGAQTDPEWTPKLFGKIIT